MLADNVTLKNARFGLNVRWRRSRVPADSSLSLASRSRFSIASRLSTAMMSVSSWNSSAHSLFVPSRCFLDSYRIVLSQTSSYRSPLTLFLYMLTHTFCPKPCARHHRWPWEWISYTPLRSTTLYSTPSLLNPIQSQYHPQLQSQSPPSYLLKCHRNASLSKPPNTKIKHKPINHPLFLLSNSSPFLPLIHTCPPQQHPAPNKATGQGWKKDLRWKGPK